MPAAESRDGEVAGAVQRLDASLEAGANANGKSGVEKARDPAPASPISLSVGPLFSEVVTRPPAQKDTKASGADQKRQPALNVGVGQERESVGNALAGESSLRDTAIGESESREARRPCASRFF